MMLTIPEVVATGAVGLMAASIAAGATDAAVSATAGVVGLLAALLLVWCAVRQACTLLGRLLPHREDVRPSIDAMLRRRQYRRAQHAVTDAALADRAQDGDDG